MNYKKFLAAASAIAMIVVAMLFVSGGSAGAQSKFNTLYSFTGGTDGSQPFASLVVDAAGNLYGTTSTGGATGNGVVFKLTPTSTGKWSESVLHNFGSDEANPMGGLVFDSAGNLYGTTSSYNNCIQLSECGTVFELSPTANGWTETVLYRFGDQNSPNGALPQGNLIFDSAGNLYGTAEGGTGDCSPGCGVVFELSPSSNGWTERVLYDFTAGSDGGDPMAGLVFDTAGNLYGTAAIGGVFHCPYRCGVVFELSPTSNGNWKESVIYSFPSGTHGSFPYAGLIFDKAGNLYGTTYYGNDYGPGVAFKLTPTSSGTWREKTLHSFSGGADGLNPSAGLVFDPAPGSLYGTVANGGTLGYGIVFKLKLKKTGWYETVLHTFTGAPGAYPNAGLIVDGKGNLYGTTTGDGSKTFGSVFEITP